MSIYHADCQGYHDSIADARKCAGVGYGGEPSAPRSGPVRVPNARTAQPASVPQVKYIRALSSERKVPPAGQTTEEAMLLERQFDILGWRTDEYDSEHDKFVSKAEASAVITYLQRLPHIDGPAVTATAKGKPDVAPDVAAGRYALTGTDGQVRFYQVDRPTEGRWAGYVFVKVLIGSLGAWRKERVNRSQQPEILRLIAKDQEGAARLFGQKAKQCGHCHSPLSTPQSRAAGYGETCADNHGYWYPKLEEALRLLKEMGEPLDMADAQ
jgi:hypothetical protein